jgi:hypothetical protein
MTRLLAIDPGCAASGVAVFEDGVLVRAFLANVTEPEKRYPDPGARACAMVDEITIHFLTWSGSTVDEVVGEWPRTYPTGRRGGSPATAMFPLAGIIVGVACALHPATLTTYTARTWSEGTKKIRTGDGRTTARGRWIAGRLVKEELDVWDGLPDKGNHDIVDAIGIGFHHLGRVKLRRS